MTKVYRVSCDMEKFQSLAWLDEKLARTEPLNLDGHPRKATWPKPAPAVSLVDPQKKPADFMALGESRNLVISRSHPLADFFDLAGESLPLKVATGQKGLAKDLVVLNVTECLNVLNVKSSVYTPAGEAEQLAVTKYVFYHRWSESTLFTDFRTRLSEVYCREETGQYSYPEGHGDDGNEFKAAYEFHKATGLKFELLWEG